MSVFPVLQNFKLGVGSFGKFVEISGNKLTAKLAEFLA